MAENETIDRLRWSLAQKRMQANVDLHEIHEQGSLPSLEEVLESAPVRFMTEHPVAAGVAAGTIFLLGPSRLLRIATATIGMLQTVRTLRAAQRTFMTEP